MQNAQKWIKMRIFDRLWTMMQNGRKLGKIGPKLQICSKIAQNDQYQLTMQNAQNWPKITIKFDWPIYSPCTLQTARKWPKMTNIKGVL